jgi:condensin complex subunit 3
LKDVTTKNAFARFDKALTKRFTKQLEGFNEEEFRQLEDLKELFEFLDEIISDDEEGNELPPQTKKRTAR